MTQAGSALAWQRWLDEMYLVSNRREWNRTFYFADARRDAPREGCRLGSNQRASSYEDDALPAELRQPTRDEEQRRP